MLDVAQEGLRASSEAPEVEDHGRQSENENEKAMKLLALE